MKRRRLRPAIKRQKAHRKGEAESIYRPASLISVWATAPLLHNNSVGLFNNDPSVDGRLTVFDDAIRKLLWPAKRAESSGYNEATPERLKQDHGLIWRTTQVTYLTLPAKYAPTIFLKLPFLKDWQSAYSVGRSSIRSLNGSSVPSFRAQLCLEGRIFHFCSWGARKHLDNRPWSCDENG